MKTCRLTDEVIEKLYANWITFYNKRVDAVNFLRGQKLDEINNEVKEEMKREYYPKDEIVEWYEGKLQHMVDWISDAKKGLDKAEENFETIYQIIKNAVYTEEDLGYTYIYDFYKCEVRKVKHDKQNVVSVKFSMYHWDYSYYPFKVEKIHFVAPKVKFTPWEEQ